ncbi:MAG: hypothetical protein ABIT37_08605 [Luteolibacter sp.]
MKPLFFIPALFLSMLPVLQAQGTRTVVMREAATHEDLTNVYRKAEQADPMRNLQPAKGSDPSVVNQPKDLVASSDIVCFGGTATLVPKHAILNIPKNLAGRLKYLPGSRIQSWADFFAMNRGWITTVEVSRVQAEGNKAIDEKISDRISKSSNLIVATYMGGPISVLPPKVAPPSQVVAETPTAKP